MRMKISDLPAGRYMNKTRIEWVINPDGTPGYTWNLITGCENGCPHCYARNLIETRLKAKYPYGFEPTFHRNRFSQPYHHKKPARIFVSSLGTFCAPWVPKIATSRVISVARENPHHTFMFLTWFTENLLEHYFPPNCWVGTTVTGENQLKNIKPLRSVKDIRCVRFVSFEPLLEHLELTPEDLWGIDWVIIGGRSPVRGVKRFKPPREWVNSLLKVTHALRIPVFLKDNLFYPDPIGKYRQLPVEASK